jgi:putative endonuclease
MFYVYMLRSMQHPKQRYVGYTSDLKARLASHNRAENSHTAKYAPWNLEAYVAFSDEAQAKDFETYLKTGSGQAFANKRFWRNPPT